MAQPQGEWKQRTIYIVAASGFHGAEIWKENCGYYNRENALKVVEKYLENGLNYMKVWEIHMMDAKETTT